MSRRSRAAAAPAISLFSFQDIMTTVMGILILVTLMMALDLTAAVSKHEAALPPPPAAADAAPAAPALADLEREADRLQAEYDALLREATLAAELSVSDARLNDARAQLEQTYAQIHALQTLAEQASAQLDELTAAARERQDQLREAVALEARAVQLSSALAAAQLHPRLTYILQEANTRQPLLLEVTGSSLALGLPQARQWSLAFTDPNPQVRLKQLAAWARTRTPREEYFVILLKPSGFGEPYEQVVATLHKLGFGMGTDLVPETAFILTPP